MGGIVGTRRHGQRTLGEFLRRTVNLQLAVLLAETVHGRALGFDRILDRGGDLHLDADRLARFERKLPLVTAVAQHVADDARRTIEHDFGTGAQQQLARLESPLGGVLLEIRLAEFLHVAHGQVGAFGQTGVRGAAITVERHIMGVLGESSDETGLGRTAREDDTVPQVAGREIERHPASRVVDGQGTGIAGIDDIDVVARVAEFLVITRQIGTVLGDPCLERHVLERVIGIALPLGAGRQRKRGDQGGKTRTESTYHIHYLHVIRLYPRGRRPLRGSARGSYTCNSYPRRPCCRSCRPPPGRPRGNQVTRPATLLLCRPCAYRSATARNPRLRA